MYPLDMPFFTIQRLGGDSMVEVTTAGIRPDYKFLKEVSEATGVNIVCSTGYYLAHTLDQSVHDATVEQLTQNMRDDLNIG